MNIKNLKIFNVPKAKTRLYALTLAVTLIGTSLTGCGSSKKSSILEGTLLEKTIVATINGDVTIVRPTNSSRNTSRSTSLHKHYFDIVNGQTLTDYKECTNYDIIRCDEIVEIGSLLYYLTEEEMMKAAGEGLSYEDIVSIVYRIKQSQQEENMLIRSR